MSSHLYRSAQLGNHGTAMFAALEAVTTLQLRSGASNVTPQNVKTELKAILPWPETEYVFRLAEWFAARLMNGVAAAGPEPT